MRRQRPLDFKLWLRKSPPSCAQSSIWIRDRAQYEDRQGAWPHGSSFTARARRRGDRIGACPLLAQSGHPSLHRTCPLSGVKQTWFFCGISLSRLLWEAKRTCPFALHMSAYDPKRTLTSLRCRCGGERTGAFLYEINMGSEGTLRS